MSGYRLDCLASNEFPRRTAGLDRTRWLVAMDQRLHSTGIELPAAGLVFLSPSTSLRLQPRGRFRRRYRLARSPADGSRNHLAHLPGGAHEPLGRLSRPPLETPAPTKSITLPPAAAKCHSRYMKVHLWPKTFVGAGAKLAPGRELL